MRRASSRAGLPRFDAANGCDASMTGATLSSRRMLRRITAVRRRPMGICLRRPASPHHTFWMVPFVCRTAGCDALPLPAQALSPPSTLPVAHNAPEVKLSAVAA